MIDGDLPCELADAVRFALQSLDPEGNADEPSTHATLGKLGYLSHFSWTVPDEANQSQSIARYIAPENLAHLSLRSGESLIRASKVLSTASSLKSLELFKVQLTDDTAAFLRGALHQNRNLTRLSFESCSRIHSIIEALPPSVENLTLMEISFQSFYIGLKELKGVRDLAICCCILYKESTASLGALKDLHTLDLRGTEFPWRGLLGSVLRMRKLRRLDVSGWKGSDEYSKRLASELRKKFHKKRGRALNLKEHGIAERLPAESLD